MITYAPMMATLHSRGKKLTDLLDNPGMSSTTLAKFRKDEYVSLELIDRVCVALNCEIHEIVALKKDAPTA